MYGTTYDDLAGTPPRFAWQMIRSLRARPPGLAGKDSRRRATFVAALEQAEQLMTAAADVGVATRPLLIFYALSQAGRAVCATGEPDRNAWEPHGHGIKWNLDGPRASRCVADVRVVDTNSGSFRRVAAVLGSSSFPEPTRLGDLWPLICSPFRFALEGSGETRPLSIHGSFPSRIPVNGPVRLRVTGLPNTLGARVDEHDDPSHITDRYLRERRQVTEHLAGYPGTAGFEFITADGNPTGFQAHGHGQGSIELQWPSTAGVNPERFIAERSIGYRATNYFFPALHGTDAPTHPMIAWWGVLFALSSLCRYEPRQWVDLTDVDTNPDAVAIQHLLNEALTVLPETIHRALTHTRSVGSDGSKAEK